jgi:hypothetical protein
MRRLVSLAIATAALVVPVGCNWLTRPASAVSPDRPPPDKVVARPATDFVTYLNRQANYLQTVRYDDVNLNVSLPGQMVPGMSRGLLVCGKPNNFRLTAGLIVGGDQLDVGSNDAEMWMYVKHSETPFLYCSHTEFARTQHALPVKFEPAWVLQALGMATFDPNGRYEVKYDAGRNAYLLKYLDTTADGQRVMKVVEFAYDAAGGSVPQVRRHAVMSADEKEMIAVAVVKRVTEQSFRLPSGETAVVQVPTDVSLRWPREQVQMDLRLGRVKVNEGMTQDTFDSLFRRPRQIGSADPVNLADYVTGQRAVGTGRGGRSADALPRK